MARLRAEKIKVPRPLLRCHAHLLNKVLMVHSNFKVLVLQAFKLLGLPLQLLFDHELCQCRKCIATSRNFSFGQVLSTTLSLHRLRNRISDSNLMRIAIEGPELSQVKL